MRTVYNTTECNILRARAHEIVNLGTILRVASFYMHRASFLGPRESFWAPESRGWGGDWYTGGATCAKGGAA